MVECVLIRLHGIPFIFQLLLHPERLIGHFYHNFEGKLIRKSFEIVMSTNIHGISGLVKIKVYALYIQDRRLCYA